MVYHGIVKNGLIVFDDPVRLPEGAEVRVDVVATKMNGPLPKTNPSTLFERLKPVIGIVNDLPADAARNTDHYLYGHPKQ